jgi:hypothetical protein
VSVLTGGVVDAVAIMAVVGINAVIGYTTESQSERVIHSLRNLVTPRVLVVRDGKVVELDVQMVVPGDLLVLREDARRQQAAQAELVAFGVGEGGAFVEQRIVEEIGAAFGQEGSAHDMGVWRTRGYRGGSGKPTTMTGWAAVMTVWRWRRAVG